MRSKLLLRFNTALSFLTVFFLPASGDQPLSDRDLASSFAYFPWIGLILGSIWVAVGYLGSRFWPANLTAVWLVMLETVLTRGLHLDGLADCADGIGGAFEPARRLEIMKDSRVGAFGVLALVLAVVAKIAAVSWLVQRHRWGDLCLIPIICRYAMVLVAVRSPYARKEGGLGKPFLEQFKRKDLYFASSSVLVMTVLLVRYSCWIYLGALLPLIWLIRRGAVKALGGVTGDVLGATNELAEIVMLSIAVAIG